MRLCVLLPFAHQLAELTICPSIKRYFPISFSRPALTFDHKISFGPADDTFPSPPNRNRGAWIIIRRSARLQGETFSGLWQRQRKLCNVANGHHLLCLLGHDFQPACLDMIPDQELIFRSTIRAALFYLPPPLYLAGWPPLPPRRMPRTELRWTRSARSMLCPRSASASRNPVRTP